MADVYCETCNDFVEYTAGTVHMDREFKGVRVKYDEVECRCARCRNPVWVGKYHDSNLDALYDAYRESKGIISRSDILKILKKYKIGARPLSTLLGWGANTIQRFADGDVPSEKKSQLLKKLMECPEEYFTILEGNSSMLTEVAYRKTYDACRKLIDEDRKKNKLMAVAEYIVSRVKGISALWTQKILYYVHGFGSALGDNLLYGAKCEAWMLGPVYREVYNSQRIKQMIDAQNGYNTGSIVPSCDALTDKDKELLDGIISAFEKYSCHDLVEFTHHETPWLQAREGLASEEPSDRIISGDSIREYFTKVCSEYGIKDPKDISKYPAEMYKKVYLSTLD